MRAATLVLTVGTTCLALAACSREPPLDTATLQSVSAEATIMLASAPLPMRIPSANWPKTIRALNPQFVRTASEGLYIVTGSFFVEEQGYFVPRDEAVISPSAGSDPSFKFLGESVYWYEIKG